MNKTQLLSIFERDLNKLITEISLYNSEDNIWRVEKNISNSAGNLTLHLIGNLHTFIGKEIGKTSYVRNRVLEFSEQNVSKQKLIDGILETIDMVKIVMQSVTEAQLQQDYPILKFSKPESTEYLLVHLATHLTYHLGQINYHRRFFED